MSGDGATMMLGTAGRTGRSEPAQRKGGAKAALLAVGLPVAGAVVDELTGSGVGLAFAVCTVAGTLLAALLSSPAGWWWVATAPPIQVLAITAAAELAVHGEKYQGKALATGAARWVVDGFPVMAAAVVTALLAILVRIALDRRSHRG